MALAGWSVTRTLKNIEYIERWEIEDFDLAWGVGEGKIHSKTFTIPGVEGFFHMELAMKREKQRDGIGFAKPKDITIGGQSFKAKSYFSVSLKSTNEETKAAGKLEIIKQGAETLSGKFGDPTEYKFEAGPEQVFLPNVAPSLILQLRNGSEHATGSGFYTLGSTSLLTLVATITIAGKMVNVGGREEEDMKQARVLDFQPFLSNEKHSDVLLKSDDATFPCHKVVLAARWELRIKIRSRIKLFQLLCL